MSEATPKGSCTMRLETWAIPTSTLRPCSLAPRAAKCLKVETTSATSYCASMKRFPVSSLSLRAMTSVSRSNKSAIFATSSLRALKLHEVKTPESKDARAAPIASKTSVCVAWETVATTL